MSLINKMLQDLDARGGAARPVAGSDVRPVAVKGSPRTAIAIGAGIGALIVAAGVGGWYVLHRAPAATAAAPVAVSKPAPTPAPAPVLAPVLAPAPAPSAAPTADAPVIEAPTTPPPEAVAPTGTAASAEATGTAAPRQAVTASGAGSPLAGEARPGRTRPPRTERTPTAASGAPVPGSDVRAVPGGEGASVPSRQKAESAYRRALAALQEGRVGEAIATLDGAVQVDPRHEAARQTLVGLLVETGRVDEAMRQAQLGLALDANQPQLAMVLARLQVERGGAADETLMRSLPHAAGNPDYLAFLAGVLQKQGRHREAAQQYEAALRLRPANGIWWMGLGISQQADNLRANAREAFRKAREAGLSPELQAFVERRLGQLE